MIDICFNWKNKAPKILLLGAHADDIEIGCLGTIHNLCSKYRNAEIYWVVFSANKIRREEAINSANSVVDKILKKKIIIKDFMENNFPYHGEKIKKYFDEIKIKFDPDIIFTPYHKDLHQDHRIISELTLNTFRNHMILEFEIPKYDGDMGKPQLFYPLNQETLNFKVLSLFKHFKSQANKPWFTEETFKAIARIRGIESKTDFAEAFYCRKIVWSI